MNHPLSDMMTNSMSKIRDMIDVNTVVGDPITTPGGVTIIPVTKVSIGYGGGGSDFAMKNMPANRDNPFGGGAGAGIKITPVAFLVIRGENVRMLPVAEPASTSVDRLTELLPDLLEKGERFDEVIAIGPLIMMKFVCLTTKEYGQKTVVSMNPIMIDGTGMCGGCRLTVGGEVKFACVDGPDFDGHLVDFDEAMSRSRIYAPFERHAYEEACNLFQKEVR